MEIMMKSLGEIITGNTPSKKNEEFWNSGDIYFVKPDIISDNGVNEIFESNEYISELARKKARIVSKDSIFITCIGSIGKIGIALEGEYAFNQQINAIVPNDKVVPKYLAYNLLYNKPRLVSIANAPVVPIINKSQFGDFTINIDLDKNKQSEIVDVLDKLTYIIKQRTDELSALDNLIKARFVELFGDPRCNPYGFSKKQLKDTCKVVTGNTPSRSVEKYYGDYIEWIKTDNIVSGLLNPTKASEKLSEEGMKVGRTVAFNQQINAVVPVNYNILFLYVLLQLSKEYLVGEINMALKGILSKAKLEEKEFIVPPMELQEQFADFVKQVDKTKVALQRSLEKVQMLFDSLMQNFFDKHE